MEYNDSEYIEYDDTYYSDEDVESVISESDEEYDQYILNPYKPHIERPSVRWTIIKIGKEIFEISTYGHIKPYRSLEQSTEGILLQGTPFRYYRFQDNTKYFMHELVWQAFNGTPMENYEIKHKSEYTNKCHKIYSNRLHNITLVPKIKISQLKLNRLENKNV
jgi:hypothetical protein